MIVFEFSCFEVEFFFGVGVGDVVEWVECVVRVYAFVLVEFR